MPTVTVRRKELYDLIGREFSTAEFEDLCFQFGIELDGEEELEGGLAALRIEVPANRYDLLCLEGLGLAIRTFLGRTPAPLYSLSCAEPCHHLVVKKEVSSVRPYMLSAILRNIRFTEASYASFIDLQEKLHHNICRRRQLASVGTHDLDTLVGPFTYDALPSSGFSFIPLNQTEEVDGDGMMRLLEGHQQLKQYLHLLGEAPRLYPLFLDSRGKVGSVPPIINSEHSKITLNTRHIFIDVTATDLTKAEIVLNTLVTAFSLYCSPQFCVEPVRVEYEEGHSFLSGKSFIYPRLDSWELPFSLKYCCSLTGIGSLSPEAACDLLGKMMIPTTKRQKQPGSTENKEDFILCSHVPITRSDILHPCDLAEDMAIAFGFNQIPTHEFPSVCEQDVNSLCEQLRREFAACGYHECLNWGLLSVKEAFDFLRREAPSLHDADTLLRSSPLNCTDQKNYLQYNMKPLPVRIGNPKAREFEMVRSTLIPALLKSLHSNQHQELPLRLFETGDCVQLDPESQVFARNHRHVAALYSNNSGSGLEEIHGLLDTILYRLQLEAVYDEVSGMKSGGLGRSLCRRKYHLQPFEDPVFLPGRSVQIVVEPDHVILGLMGVVHPEVLKNFSLPMPVSLFEITLEPFLAWLSSTELQDV